MYFNIFIRKIPNLKYKNKQLLLKFIYKKMYSNTNKINMFKMKLIILQPNYILFDLYGYIFIYKKKIYNIIMLFLH